MLGDRLSYLIKRLKPISGLNAELLIKLTIKPRSCWRVNRVKMISRGDRCR